MEPDVCSVDKETLSLYKTVAPEIQCQSHHGTRMPVSLTSALPIRLDCSCHLGPQSEKPVPLLLWALALLRLVYFRSLDKGFNQKDEPAMVESGVRRTIGIRISFLLSVH